MNELENELDFMKKKNSETSGTIASQGTDLERGLDSESDPFILDNQNKLN
jgi:hypothetical protein